MDLFFFLRPPSFRRWWGWRIERRNTIEHRILIDFVATTTGQRNKSSHETCVSGKSRLARVVIASYVMELIELVWSPDHSSCDILWVWILCVSILQSFSTASFLLVVGNRGSSVMNVSWKLVSEPNHITHFFGVISKNVINLIKAYKRNKKSVIHNLVSIHVKMDKKISS